MITEIMITQQNSAPHVLSRQIGLIIWSVPAFRGSWIKVIVLNGARQQCAIQEEKILILRRWI